MTLPDQEFSDLEKAGLEISVTCQRCHHQKLIELTPELRGRRVAGQRFRCQEILDGIPCCGIGLPTIQKQRRWVQWQAEHARKLAAMKRETKDIAARATKNPARPKPSGASLGRWMLATKDKTPR